jgi:hypothetical protein
MSLSVLKDVTMDAFSSVTRSDWEGYCSHVRKLETEYWEKNGLLEDTIADFIIALAGEESDSSDSMKKMKRKKKIHLTTQILPFRCPTVNKKHHM